jgi:hypothetical protein
MPISPGAFLKVCCVKPTEAAAFPGVFLPENTDGHSGWS